MQLLPVAEWLLFLGHLQAGVESCVLCACAPCQCGQMRKGGGYGNDPFEVRQLQLFSKDYVCCPSALLF